MQCSSVWPDDRGTGRNADLDCCGSNRSPERVHGLERDGPDSCSGDLFSGHVFVFRGRRGDLIKLLWWDGDGLCLFAKRLERGRFIWPQATSGTVALSHAQLSMLLEGIDWRHPIRSYDPQIAV